MERKQFTIEHHAVMYAYLAGEAMRYGTAGRCALAKATVRYGNERGKRMAEYAKQENLPCNMLSYSVLKEWRPTGDGQMISGETIRSPEFVTTVKRCEWVEAWKKYDLLPYGNYYCRYVDEAIVKGFNEELHLEIAGLQSLGDPVCVFNWGYERNDTAEKVLTQMRDAVSDKYVKDFAFHTAHLFGTVTSVLMQELGDCGMEIGENAMKQFKDMFGEEYCQELILVLRENGWYAPERRI